MQLLEEEFYKYILDFEWYAKQAIQAMKDKFGLSNLRDYYKNKIPKQGHITININKDILVAYRFHGNGCEFDFSGILVDFSYIPINENHINFSPYGLFQFIQTYDKETFIKDVSSCGEMIAILESKGLIKKNTNDMEVTHSSYGIYTLI